ncbi:hypothetical protein FIV42_15615 [Persicimonas caeni]|uniref:Uncharacterized protein n=1 Tax=Persicimonas caeni TaxID=2292766 RepID=A0A4Y6PVH1_PERCE|nr:hypothetical protein [Persicimonas caeni]QDG52119.1 hypothetical protein FIV42_15615 [Persicimonas caeni]QED33340.1 hypothetical protein FRD00_15610 [Persicimonas caeni]
MKPSREHIQSSLQALLAKVSEYDDVINDAQLDDLSLVIETDSVLAQITHWPQEHFNEGSTEWIVHEIDSGGDISPHHATWETHQEFERLQQTFLLALRDVTGLDLL